MQFQHAEAPGLDQPDLLAEEGEDVAVAAAAAAPVRNEPEAGSQRTVLVWFGQEIQALSRPDQLICKPRQA